MKKSLSASLQVTHHGYLCFVEVFAFALDRMAGSLATAMASATIAVIS